MKVFDWLVANQELLLLILAVLPHAVALLPAKLRTSRVRHVVKILDLLAGNYLGAKNHKKQTVKDILDKQRKKPAA